MLIRTKTLAGQFKDQPLRLVLINEYFTMARKSDISCVTYATFKDYKHLENLIQLGKGCIVVIDPKDIMRFYLMNLHTKISFAFNRQHYKIKERWSFVYDTTGIFRNHEPIQMKAIRLWAFLKGWNNDDLRLRPRNQE